MASIIHGLHYSFWPLAVTDVVDCPTIVNNLYQPLKDASHIAFTWSQCDTEVMLGCFSPTFDQLLPAMTSVPVGVVPKPHSSDLHLVIDQMAGDFSLDSHIPREGVTVPPDNLHDLGCSLLQVQLEHGNNCELVIFKSDVS